MKNLEKYSNSWVLKLIIFVIMFLVWLLPFVDKANCETYELVGQLIVGGIACALLILFKNTFLVLQIILLFPFMFARQLTLYTIPIQLYILIPMVIVSFVVHLIIHKQKIKMPLFFIGLAAIGLSVFLGGIDISYEDKLLKTLLLFGISAGLVILFVFFASTAKPTFKDLCVTMSILGAYLVLQVVVFEIINIETFLKFKNIFVGWGVTNNIAMMLLLVFPFTFYLTLNAKGIKKVLLYVASFAEIYTIIFTYSRGAIFSAFVAFLILLIVLIAKNIKRKETITFGISLFGSMLLFVLLVLIVSPDLLDAIYKNLTQLNFDNLNGRVPIYEEVLEKFLEKPIFGHGIFSSYENENFYAWSHNSFLEAASTLGSLGLISLIVHHVEKYAFCFKKISFEKITILFAFIASDIYGFFDVSYFFINFLIVLLFILICCNNIFNKKEVA